MISNTIFLKNNSDLFNIFEFSHGIFGFDQQGDWTFKS